MAKVDHLRVALVLDHHMKLQASVNDLVEAERLLTKICNTLRFRRGISDEQLQRLLSVANLLSKLSDMEQQRQSELINGFVADIEKEINGESN